MSQDPSRRYDNNIATVRWQLDVVPADRYPPYKLTDQRTGHTYYFESPEVRGKLGRGDVVALYHDDSQVGSIYQHQCSDYLLDVLEHLEEHDELPSPEYAGTDAGIES